MMNQVRHTLLVVAGMLFVGLGVVGIFLPILPTTPFLLLAAYCFARSSDRFYHWLLTNRWFGEYIRNYREGRGMPLREKIISLTALWLTVGLTVAFSVSAWWLRLLLLGIALGVTTHLVRLPTYHRPAAGPPLEDARSPQEVGIDSE
jgi:uncharacterized protein